jgi:hypothetical protein
VVRAVAERSNAYLAITGADAGWVEDQPDDLKGAKMVFAP